MTPQLLLDQFGNYVIQCCLSMGSNQFIFDAMVDNMTTIASGRFGARAMRTCLDSKYTTKRQQKYVSASIISHAHELVASSNGSILVTWLLDSSLADRYQLLVAKLSGNFADLCKNKIASATIIKLASQTIDKEARSIVLGELSTVHSLKIILYDLLVGTPALTRIIASIVNSNEQEKFARQIKSVLDGLRDINWSHSSIKRLADEVKIILGGVSRSNDSFAKTSYMIATPVGF